MLRTLTGGVVLLASIALVVPALKAGDPGDARTYVKATATAGKPDADGKQIVTITMAIDRPWHAYANPVGSKDLASNATKVTIRGAKMLEEMKVDYPVGQLKKDATIGEYRIYEGKTEIKAAIRRAKGDDGPLTASIHINLCDDKTSCLQPATVKVAIK
jgi:uncharacterized protein